MLPPVCLSCRSLLVSSWTVSCSLTSGLSSWLRDIAVTFKHSFPPSFLTFPFQEEKIWGRRGDNPRLYRNSTMLLKILRLQMLPTRYCFLTRKRGKAPEARKGSHTNVLALPTSVCTGRVSWSCSASAGVRHWVSQRKTRGRKAPAQSLQCLSHRLSMVRRPGTYFTYF